MFKVVEAIYHKKKLELLKSLDLNEGQHVKAIVIEIDKNRSQKAKERQLHLLDKGIDMGKLLFKERNELYER